MHGEESSRLSQDVQLLREELDITKQDLDEVQGQAIQYKAELEASRLDAENQRKQHQDLSADVSRNMWSKI